MKWLFSTLVILAVTILAVSCGNEGVKKDEPSIDINELTKNKPETHGPEVKESDIQITHPLNQQWVTSGKSIYELKCQP